MMQKKYLTDLADEAAEWREKLVEGAANFDDEVMELYLDGKEISEDMLLRAIRKGTVAMECCPDVARFFIQE